MQQKIKCIEVVYSDKHEIFKKKNTKIFHLVKKLNQNSNSNLKIRFFMKYVYLLT